MRRKHGSSIRFRLPVAPASAPAVKPRLHVPAIGGSHQFAHFLPVAARLAERETVDVRIFAPTPEDAHELAELAVTIGVLLPPVTIMELPRAFKAVVPRKMAKLARLLAWARQLRQCEAILSTERTSTILKRLPGRCPPLIHIPHGAGDRAVGFEDRFRFFDLVLVAGPKDRDRLVAEGVVRKSACAVAGPIKVAAALQSRTRRNPLFANDRPVVLYNPHFSPKLSSAESFLHPLAQAVLDDGRYNLVIAPHIRMAQHWTVQRKGEWQALAVPDRIMVDLGSRRSTDMTYTLGADLYIGDVSSQVYEFLVRPRPCLFVNAHAADWQDNPDYAMWNLGEVVAPDCDIPAMIERAFNQHERYRQVQQTRVRAALHGLDWDAAGEPFFADPDPITRGADLVEANMQGAQFVRR